jgi:predicted metal-dependent HD superfamily phosphohydrolase
MSIQELKSEVTRLSKPDLAAFAQWFEDFIADSWDKQMEADVAAGKLDHLAKQADAQFEAGRCTPL